ncbi:MAG: succinylglutamate desuccinylase, partial [Gammaproteobacteria bacterium]|nr:succinylglutamate desuccinylase [Gammaproteobacteria bacterium]
TIECGGSFEDVADRIAQDGLERYFTAEELFAPESRDYDIELFFNPVRIEMHQASTIACGESGASGFDITLAMDIEHHNFGLVTPDTLLGWINPAAMDKMAAFDAERSNHFKQLYREQDGALYPRRNQKLFMITSNLDIARSDCLWYAALAE